MAIKINATTVISDTPIVTYAFAAIKRLFTERPGNASFNIVLHSKNFNFNEIYDWFSERFPNPALTIEGIVNVYDDYTLKSTGQFTRKQYEELTNNVFLELINGATRFNSLSRKKKDFIDSLINQRPFSALGQKCGMDRSDQIAVDLMGNVMTCQNTGATPTHKIGTVSDFDKIALVEATHLSFREECIHCPIVQICKGSCMFLKDDLFAQSCFNEYYFALGVMKAALFDLTEMVLMKVEGDIRRPSFTDEHLKKHPKLMELY